MDEDFQAVEAPHDLSVRLRPHGVSYAITCLGDQNSWCHIWADDLGNPDTLSRHPDCSVSDWFYDDTRAFVEDGYVGPERDGITSGRIRVRTWGEDGAQWHYEGDKASWE
jgi:hypothetical protein